MASFRYGINGLDALIARARGLGVHVEQVVGKVLFEDGEEIMTKAKLDTPVLTGALRSTGHVELPKMEGDRLVVVLGFGGPAAGFPDVGYAVEVHENLTARHGVGHAKFLETPFVADKPKVKADLAAALSAAIKAKMSGK